jgi:hypothetical protein
VTEPVSQHSPPLVDPGNPNAVGNYPALLTVGPVQTPMGPQLVLTLRCGPATVSALVDKDRAELWAAAILQAAQHLSGIIVPNGFRGGLST